MKKRKQLVAFISLIICITIAFIIIPDAGSEKIITKYSVSPIIAEKNIKPIIVEKNIKSTIFEKNIKPVFFEENTKNILILGIDSRHGERSRSDTMLLLNIKNDKINLISIPRDTLVELKGRGIQKINAAYAYGGVELSKKTVEQLLNVKIDNHMVVNFKAIEKGVDALGGFDVQIPKKIKISDPEFKRYFTLKEGPQKLNGVQTLGYLRYRSDGRGDIGRIGRQQSFLKDIQSNFLRLDNIVVLPKVYKAVKSEISTDMDFGDMMDYFIRGYELKDNVDYHMLMGYCKYINEVSYYVGDNQSLQALRQVLQ